MTDFEMIHLCPHCIDAIRSRGEKVFVGERIEDTDTDPYPICEWCEDYTTGILYECHF